MPRVCGVSHNRAALSMAGTAVCVHCLAAFAPGLVVEWVDAGETALCPACGIDAVVGFDCRPDAEWIMQERCRRCG